MAKVVFTAAIMDAFHNGHKNIIEEMKKRGDVIVVVLHDDKSCYEIKGKFPIQPLYQRMYNVYTAGADIVLFTENTDPADQFSKIIRWFGANNSLLFLRGDDNQNPPGKWLLDKCFIEQEYIPYTEGISSTKRRKCNS